VHSFHEFVDQSHTQCRGTAVHKAPELMRSRNYDKKADIYSLGVIAEKLFDFNINKQKFKQVKSKLEMKFSSLEELFSRMISTQKELQPSCDQILSEKESWTLNSIDSE
jgi:serine/threonine protein kinase